MRIKRGIVSRRKHHKILQRTKGFRMTKSRLIKVAKEAVLHAGQYAFEGRKNRKRDFRRLWIQRINAGLSQINEGPSYSTFMHLLEQNQIKINRKMLSELATNEPAVFQDIVSKVYGK